MDQKGDPAFDVTNINMGNIETNTLNGNFLIVGENDNNVEGEYGIVFGDDNNIKGEYNFVMGNNNLIEIGQSFIFGSDKTSNNKDFIVDADSIEFTTEDISSYNFKINSNVDVQGDISCNNIYALNIPSINSGTWTPQLRFNGNSSGFVYSIQSGFYIKQGSIVYIFYNITLSGKIT